MSNDYNQIILERFFEEALEEGLTDAEASKQAYARFWEEDIPSERVRQMQISNRLQACSPIVRYPYRFWDVELKCLEYEDLEHLKEDYGSRLVKAELIPGTKAP